MKNNIKNILVSGSLVYDKIFVYPGYFKDSIISKKINCLALTFHAQRIDEYFGGTAGNIAYNLSLLNERPTILSTVGEDYILYKKWLVKNKVDISQIREIKNKKTALFYVITDKAGSQIASYFDGALAVNRGKLNEKLLKNSIAIISPGNQQDMYDYARLYQKKGVKYIFDPGQELTRMPMKILKTGVGGAEILIANDYEISLILKKLGWTKKRLIDKVKILIITKGVKGSEIYYNNKVYRIAAVKSKKIIDPVGAGDAYRAGLIKGLIMDWPFQKIGRFASLVASYAVGNLSAQNHKFIWNDLEKDIKIVLMINYKNTINKMWLIIKYDK